MSKISISEKVFFSGFDLIRPSVVKPTVVQATKMPRTAIISVVRDKKTGYLNAAPYSAGITSVNPLHIITGIKTQTTIESYRDAEEFCIAVPTRKQVNHMWVTALNVPRGINEIDIADWHSLESKYIDTPGIEECPLNLECKKVLFAQLPAPWRAVVIGEVVGVSINNDLMKLPKSKVIKHLPMHEAGVHPKTGLYGPSLLSGELIPPQNPFPQQATEKEQVDSIKTYVNKNDLYNPKSERVLMNATFPRPAYILMTADKSGHPSALPICGGYLQSTQPAIHVPVPKNSDSYRNIKDTGEFVISIPDRSIIDNFELMEENPQGALDSVDFNLLPCNEVNIPGLGECPINIDCKVVIFEDIPDADYAILIGRKVGISLDKEIFEHLDKRIPDYQTYSYLNELYSKFFYAVMDQGMSRRWGFQDINNLTVRPLPSWGSRYMGGWWANFPLNYWLIELVDEGLITKRDFHKICANLELWNNGVGPEHLAEYFDVNLKNEVCNRLTKLFKMMAWAHRDPIKWDKIRAYLCTFPEIPSEFYAGPLCHEKWHKR